MVSNNTDGGPLSFGPNAKAMHIGLRLLAAEFHGYNGDPPSSSLYFLLLGQKCARFTNLHH